MSGEQRDNVIAIIRAMDDPEGYCRLWLTGNRDPWQQLACENPDLMWLSWEMMTGITREEVMGDAPAAPSATAPESSERKPSRDDDLHDLDCRARESSDIGVSLMVLTEVVIEGVRAIRDVMNAIDGHAEEMGRLSR